LIDRSERFRCLFGIVCKLKNPDKNEQKMLLQMKAKQNARLSCQEAFTREGPDLSNYNVHF
jgi:ferredoxin